MEMLIQQYQNHYITFKNKWSTTKYILHDIYNNQSTTKLQKVVNYILKISIFYKAQQSTDGFLNQH